MSPAARSRLKPRVLAASRHFWKCRRHRVRGSLIVAKKRYAPAMDAKSRGVKVHVESVLPHFLLDKSYAERPGVEGMKHVMSPPLRAKQIKARCGRRLRAGRLTRLARTIARSNTEQKLLGKDSFVNIPMASRESKTESTFYIRMA